MTSFVPLPETGGLFPVPCFLWSVLHTAGLPGCTMLTGAALFPRTKPRRKEKDDLKLYKYINQIRVAFGGQFKAVKESGCPVCRRLVEILDGRDIYS